MNRRCIGLVVGATAYLGAFGAFAAHVSAVALGELARAGHGAWLTTWSPAGNLIAYFSGNRREVMNADGTDVRTVTHDDGGRFARSPDSKSLAIVRQHRLQCKASPCEDVLFTVSLDRRLLHRLATGNIDWGEPPAWTR